VTPRPNPAGAATEELLRALMVKLDGLAVTKDQRELMQALHCVAVVRMLRQASSAVTIRDVAARTGLLAYRAEAALDSLCEQGAAERDTTGPAWLYRAVSKPAPPTAGETPVAEESPPMGEPAASGKPSAQGQPTTRGRGGAPARGGEATPANALVVALWQFGLGSEVKGQGVAVTVAGAAALRVVRAQQAQGGGPVWSWRHGGREHRHPRADPEGTAEKIAICLASTPTPAARPRSSGQR
jgi:hypothetical protein